MQCNDTGPFPAIGTGAAMNHSMQTKQQREQQETSPHLAFSGRPRLEHRTTLGELGAVF